LEIITQGTVRYTHTDQTRLGVGFEGGCRRPCKSCLGQGYPGNHKVHIRAMYLYTQSPLS